MFSAPEVREGKTGSWKRHLSATSSETTFSFPLFQHSSMNLRTICLVSGDCLFVEGMRTLLSMVENYRTICLLLAVTPLTAFSSGRARPGGFAEHVARVLLDAVSRVP